MYYTVSMFFDPAIPPDPEGDAGEWDGAQSARVAFEVPTSLDFRLESADMMTMCAAQRLMQIDSVRCEALADAARYGRAVEDVVVRSVRLEIAAALRITEHVAAGLLAAAETLVHRHPEVLDSFAAARMTEAHAQFLVDSLDAVEPEFHDRLRARAVQLAETLPVGSFRRALRRLIDTVRADTLTERHEQALERRRVVIEQAEDGMAWTHHFGPAVEAHAIFGRITAIAKVLLAQDGEQRTLDQARADVFADLLIEGDTRSHPTDTRGIRATVAVTVPALALLAGEDAVDAAGDRAIATVEGIGPIPMRRARELCGGTDGWMRILTHPETGMVLSVGRDQYRPPASLRRLVRWRADRCMAPGCGMPASRCEIDHNDSWESGGVTALTNLAPFCKGHHIVKHHGRWVVRQIDDSGGAIEWISPAGRRYIVEPERRVPVFRPTPLPEGEAPF